MKTIIIDNIQYYLQPVKKVKEVFYKIGDRFYNKQEGTYILAQTFIKEVCLISLDDGNRWAKPYKVNNPQKVSLKEFKDIKRETEFIKIDK